MMLRVSTSRRVHEFNQINRDRHLFAGVRQEFFDKAAIAILNAGKKQINRCLSLFTPIYRNHDSGVANKQGRLKCR